MIKFIHSYKIIDNLTPKTLFSEKQMCGLLKMHGPPLSLMWYYAKVANVVPDRDSNFLQVEIQVYSSAEEEGKLTI
jgi:hypothetical protein